MSTLVHVTTVHPRFDIRIFRKECLSLRDLPAEVHLVVADGEGDARVEGVQIHDVGRTRGRLRRMLLLPYRAFRRVRSLKPDIVHFHDPELLPAGLALRLLGQRVIYDAHEDLPRSIMSKHWIRPGLRKLVSQIAELFEDFTARRLSAVVAATPHIGKRFTTVQPETIVATNYPVIPGGTGVPRHPEAATFVYLGAISRKRAAREMVVATALANCRLILAGPFEDEALSRELAALPAWKHVKYVGVVEHSELWDLMARSLAGLLFFMPEPNHVNSVPNKMFEYMAGRLPILCSAFESWKQIVATNRIGLTCDPNDPQAIAALMREIIERPAEAEAMGKRAREIVTTRYRWEAEAEKLVNLYRKLLADQTGHPA